MAKNSPLERAIVAAILKYLNKQPGWKAKKLHGNAYSAGWPDILAIHQGQPYFFEVKRPEPYGKPPTPLQLAELAAWEAVGAVTAVVTKVADVKEVVIKKQGVKRACLKCGLLWNSADDAGEWECLRCGTKIRPEDRNETT